MPWVLALFAMAAAAAAASSSKPVKSTAKPSGGGLMTVKLPKREFQFVKAAPTETPAGRPAVQTETLAPDGRPWVVKFGDVGSLIYDGSGGTGGITIDGVGWVRTTKYDPINPKWREATNGTKWLQTHWRPSDGSRSWSDVARKWVEDYVMPALAGIVGTAIGGPAGTAAALAITTIMRVARGSKITNALKDAAVDLLSTEVGRDYFHSAYNKLAESPYSAAAIEKSRKLIEAKFKSAPGTKEQALEAFVKGAMIGKAKRTQDRAKQIIESVLPKDDAAAFRYIMSFDWIPLENWAWWYGGVPAVAVLGRVLEKAAREVDAGKA